MQKISKGTKGSKALLNYLKTAVNSEPFIEDLNKLRKKYHVPENGFSDIKYLEKNANPYITCVMPSNWLGKDKIENWSSKLSQDVRELRRKYSLSSQFDHILAKLLFYNWDSYPNKLLESGYDLCNIHDLPAEHEMDKNIDYAVSKSSIDHKKVQKARSADEEDSRKEFPISITISPYASINDILDFVRKSKDSIRYFQDKYKEADSKIGRVRTRTTRDRNAFILKNKALPRKKISEMVKKKFGTNVDEIYIRNIISKESERRKKL